MVIGGIMQQVFASWSGGKDSCLSCFLAKNNNLKVRYLANMITEDGKRSRTHGQTPELLKVQAQAIGIPLVQRQASWGNYEVEFKNMIVKLREDGIRGGVFGDIDLDEHRQWIERVCQEVNITPHLPLWGKAQDRVLMDFVDLGFEAIVVAAKADYFGEEILGRKVDLDFIKHLKELKETKDITLCGEHGEYHTFVINGPLFIKRIQVLETRKISREGTWILEILKADLKIK